MVQLLSHVRSDYRNYGKTIGHIFYFGSYFGSVFLYSASVDWRVPCLGIANAT